MSAVDQARLAVIPRPERLVYVLMSRLLLVTLVAVFPVSSQVNVLTDNYGNDRTNANLSEIILNTSNVNAGQFGKLFSLPVVIGCR